MGHSTSSYWGKAYRLSFWRWGVTLDWGIHRFIIGRDSNPEDEGLLISALVNKTNAGSPNE